MNKITADHLNLTVQDFEKTASWYKDVFGFEIVERGLDVDGPWGVLKSGDFMLCIYESPNKEKPNEEATRAFHKIYHLGFRIRDRETWERTLVDLAIQTHCDSPVHYPHSTSWYVKDPTGYMIEVALWDQDRIRF